MTASDVSHELYEELAVGHALNALEPEDEVTFLAHLPGCAACARAVDVHLETMGHLAYATAAEEPPATLLEGIRAGIAASGRAGSFPAPLSLDAARQKRQSRTVSMTTALVGVAASFVLLAALVLSNVGLHSKINDSQRHEAAFRTSVAALLTPGANDVPLTGQGQAAAVIKGNTVKLVMSGVKANPKGSVYVLWQSTPASDTVLPVGAFTVQSTRKDDVTVIASGLKLSSTDVKALMVTVEPGTAAPMHPSTAPVFTGTV